MRSLYKQQFAVMASIVLTSFLLLGGTFFTLSYQYTVEMRQNTLQANAQYIAEQASEAIVSSVEAGGFTLQVALFHPVMRAVSGVTETTVLLCSERGQIIYATDEYGEPDAGLLGRSVSSGLLQAVQSQEHVFFMGDLDGMLDTKVFIAAEPVVVEQGGEKILMGIVVVTSESSHLLEIWQATLTMFLITALVVLLIACILSSVSSRHMTQPLNRMAQKVRQFGRGEYDVRIGEINRIDEVGELADAFNTMADSIAQSEARRSEFVANVSHELKTPMTTIAGFADGILDGTIPVESQSKYLTTISTETRRLSRLVNRMLDLSMRSSGTDGTVQQQFDICEVLIQVLVSLEQKINAVNLEVEANLPDEKMEVWGDPDAITQVCYNLLDNAIKFAEEKTALGLEIKVHNGKVIVSVTNQGDTIPPADIPFLFDRFHKADRSRSEDREGVGLGLYIVKHILDSHGEDISCTSVGKKTKFEFTLTQV